MLRCAPSKDVPGSPSATVHVILSVAKDLALLLTHNVRSEILRCAQDDMNGLSFFSIGGPKAHVTLSMTKTLFPQPAKRSPWSS